MNPLIVNEDMAVGNSIPLVFNLMVTDRLGNICTDSTKVIFSHFAALLCSTESYINQGDSTQIHSCIGGGIPPLSYEWHPNYCITDITIDNPIVWPDITTVYDVTVTDSVGCGSTFLTNWTIYVNPTSVKEITDSHYYKVFPNPISDESILNINMAYSDNEIRVFNIEGKLIWIEKHINSSIPIGEIIKQTGIYFIVLINKNRIITSNKLIRV